MARVGAGNRIALAAGGARACVGPLDQRLEWYGVRVVRADAAARTTGALEAAVEHAPRVQRRNSEHHAAHAEDAAGRAVPFIDSICVAQHAPNTSAQQLVDVALVSERMDQLGHEVQVVALRAVKLGHLAAQLTHQGKTFARPTRRLAPQQGRLGRWGAGGRCAGGGRGAWDAEQGKGRARHGRKQRPESAETSKEAATCNGMQRQVTNATAGNERWQYVSTCNDMQRGVAACVDMHLRLDEESIVPLGGDVTSQEEELHALRVHARLDADGGAGAVFESLQGLERERVFGVEANCSV